MQTATLDRDLQVTSESGKKPRVVARMSDWQYLERLDPSPGVSRGGGTIRLGG